MRERTLISIVAGLLILGGSLYAYHQWRKFHHEQVCWDNGSCKPSASVLLVDGHDLAVPVGVPTEQKWGDPCNSNCGPVQRHPNAYTTDGNGCIQLRFESSLTVPPKVYAAAVNGGGRYVATLKTSGQRDGWGVKLCQTEAPEAVKDPDTDLFVKIPNFAIIWIE